MRRLGQLARGTPAGRDRYVDLLRAGAIVAVVAGHWLVTVISYDPQGRLTGRSALGELSWARPVTWLVQVLPIFFLVGGYANAASLRSRWRRGGDSVGWLADRSGRLVRPTTVLVLLLTVAATVASARGADPALVRTVIWFATVPLWFLAAYLAVVLLAPVSYALHRRYGLVVPAVLVALVAAGDAARLAGRETLATGSFLFGWLAIHQLGYAWRDRCAAPGATPPGVNRLISRPGALALLLGGMVALLAGTLLGPYPISMINVPGERLHNMSPPSLALLSLAAAQFGLILLLAEPARRWLRRARVWQAVVGINAVILTIFLWHVTAAILLIGALDALGWLPTPAVGSAGWLFWRIPWLLMLTVVLAGLVAVFGRVEWRGARRLPTPPGWPPAGLVRALTRRSVRAVLVVAGFGAVVAGLLANAATPKQAPEPLGLPVSALVAYLAGAALLRLLRGPVPASPEGP